MERQNYFKGVIFCLVATISWGTMFPVMSSALTRVDPFSFTAIRYTIAALPFIYLLYRKEGISAFDLRKERIGLAWFFGSAGFAGFGFLVFYGQQLAGESGALTASIMMATMPLLGLLVTWMLKGIRPPIYSFAFIMLSFFGVVLVITKGNIIDVLSQPQNYTANVFLILGALAWVIYTVGGGYFQSWSPYKYTAITTILGLSTIYTVVAIMIASDKIQFPSLESIYYVTPHLFYMSFIAGFVGVLCWNMGNKIVTPLNGVLFMDVVPTTAFIVSAATGLVPSGSQIFGASCTAIALIMNNIFQRRRLKSAATSK